MPIEKPGDLLKLTVLSAFFVQRSGFDYLSSFQSYIPDLIDIQCIFWDKAESRFSINNYTSPVRKTSCIIMYLFDRNKLPGLIPKLPVFLLKN